ncbi:Transcriptional regulator, MerR family [Neorhizobium galegae bv. officinalis bv. officinalis str. HAMBI 1141]|uniref:Transcriptional regulator, MerR family n=2 Tax=Neorhizobium TaxID=1525371 RepID=A0A068TA41_NEOGA|nr:MerR family transcriptional regulator [Neorhizobium galegae]CDN54901.1 Transcriptional regulator, MerR family [Neorhizobium galegae bv. officinalis bv. officinalis str. HAMBI 1141]
MSSSAHYLSPSDAAERLGISPKALRLYEQRGLIAPVRTAAGWRTYGPVEMTRAGEIAALRALGLSLAQVARVLKGEAQELAPALAAHQAKLEAEARRIAETVEKVRNLRAGLAGGEPPGLHELTRLARPAAEIAAAFDLPWPWGGERFELRDIRPLNYVIGPLGSGKTRFARAIAGHLPGAVFVDLDRAANDAAEARARMETDPALKQRVEQALAWLVEEGAAVTPALTALLVAIEADAARIPVIDMIEQGLDQPSQEAVLAYLRNRGPGARPLFIMTRSSAILDLGAVGPDEAIILCPANHSPPSRVAPIPGAPGYEAVATCLATPDVRARTEGVIAWRPQVA